MAGAFPEIGFAVAFAGALAVTFALTPLARGVAVATGTYDHPVGYKQHARPTPYFGGIAVMGGFLVGVVAPGEELAHLWPLLIAAVGLFAIGTLDDRRGLPVSVRVVGEVAAAVLLWETGWGWGVFSDATNLVLTVLTVVGLVNAFNLMDNIDGSTAAVASVSAAGAGMLALIHNETGGALVGFAVAGACAGFLPYNLARPSRIFLGDGGSMPVGLLIAATIMAIPNGAPGWGWPIELAPLAGLVILDTSLVVISRMRRGVPVHMGARDHLTHRLLARLGSARRVALCLAAAQAALCLFVIALDQLSRVQSVRGALLCAVLGIAVIAVLEGPRWVPASSRRSA